MELHKANLEAQNQAIAVASSHPTASAGLLPVASFLIPKATTMASNTLSATANTAVTTNTVNGGVMSTSTAASQSTASDQAHQAAAVSHLNPQLAYLLKPNVESTNYYIPNPYVTAAAAAQPHAGQLNMTSAADFSAALAAAGAAASQFPSAAAVHAAAASAPMSAASASSSVAQQQAAAAAAAAGNNPAAMAAAAAAWWLLQYGSTEWVKRSRNHVEFWECGVIQLESIYF